MIALDLTPTEEARLAAVARQTGLVPADYVKKLVKEHLPPVQSEVDLNELTHNPNRSRVESGARPLFS